MRAAFLLIASILVSRSTSSETGISTKSPKTLRLFGQTIQVHPSSGDTPRPTAAPYSLYSKPNNEYTESDLRRLGFRQDTATTVTGSKLTKARCLKPFDRHEGNRFVSHSKDGPVYETNAQYVDRTMLYNRERSRMTHQKEKELRQAYLEKTGVMLPKKWAVEWRDRKRRAREMPDDVMRFKHGNGALYDDPKGRTGQQYYREVRDKENEASRKYYHNKKARRMR